MVGVCAEQPRKVSSTMRPLIFPKSQFESASDVKLEIGFQWILFWHMVPRTRRIAALPTKYHANPFKRFAAWILDLIEPSALFPPYFAMPTKSYPAAYRTLITSMIGCRLAIRPACISCTSHAHECTYHFLLSVWPTPRARCSDIWLFEDAQYKPFRRFKSLLQWS
jgi:hypothetical protein